MVNADEFCADMSAGADLSALFYACPCGKADTVEKKSSSEWRLSDGILRSCK